MASKLSHRNLHLGSDIVFGIDLPRNPLHRTGLGISAFRSTHPGESNYKNYEALALIIDEYIEKTGLPVKIFAFDSELENDTSAAIHIYNLVKNKPSVELVFYLGEVDGFLEKFNSCANHLTIRFHSAVLADALGIPFYPICYSNKTASLISDRHPNSEIVDIKELAINNLNQLLITEKIIAGSTLCLSELKELNPEIHFEKLSELLG
ncbi:Polysaccharide pyruvyl transferase [compost metagenome]